MNSSNKIKGTYPLRSVINEQHEASSNRMLPEL